MNHIHTIKSIRSLIKNQLIGYYEPGERDSLADLMLEEYLGLSRVSLRLDADLPVPGGVIVMVTSALSQLKKHVPVQYVLGKAYFCDMVFKVNEHVLIPRRETEELVGWIAEDHTGGRISGAPLDILDLGTGSGCIAITLKKKIPDALVMAVDISPEALALAQINAGQLGAGVLFGQMDLLDAHQWETLGLFDVMVSNPPYVLPSDRERMGANVLDHEPATALFVSEDRPLRYYEAIAAFSGNHLKPHGKIYVEINEQMGKHVCELFNHAGFKQTVLRKDLHGRDRMVRIS